MSYEFPHLQKLFPDYSPLFTSSATCAIYLALKSIEKKYGLGEVILPSTICPSVPLAAAQAGFTVRLCDVDLETFSLSLDTVKPHVNAATKAILVAYLFGKKIKIQELIEYANKHRIVVIEDIAQAIGGQINNRFLGSYGDMTVVSFNPIKIVGKTNAGCLLVKDKADYVVATEFERRLPQSPDTLALSEKRKMFRDITMEYFERSRTAQYQSPALAYTDLFISFSDAFIFRSSALIESKKNLDQELSQIKNFRKNRYAAYKLYEKYLSPSVKIVHFTPEEMIWRLPVIVPSYQHQRKVITDLRKAGYLISDHYFPMSVFMGQKGCQNSEEIGLRAINLWVDHKVNRDDIIKSVQLVNSIIDNI